MVDSPKYMTNFGLTVNACAQNLLDRGTDRATYGMSMQGNSFTKAGMYWRTVAKEG